MFQETCHMNVRPATKGSSVATLFSSTWNLTTASPWYVKNVGQSLYTSGHMIIIREPSAWVIEKELLSGNSR